MPAKTPFPPMRRSYYNDPRIKTSGTRTKSSINKLVIHTAEGCRTALCVASFFAQDHVQASTHAAVDMSGRMAEQMLSDNKICWGAPGANHDGWHIELCGFAKWDAAEWLAHEKMLRNAAWRFALRARWYKIPLKWLTPAEMKADPNASGLTTHVDVNKAFGKSDHYDPGKHFPKTLFLGYVREYTRDYLT